MVGMGMWGYQRNAHFDGVIMKHFRLLFIVLAASLLSSCACSSPDPGVPDAILDSAWDSGQPLDVGITTLKLRPGGQDSVSLNVRKFGPHEVNHGDPFWFGEDEDAPPRKTCVEGMQLTIKGQTIHFPKTMVASLYEPHWLRVQVDGRKVYLIIDGLDAADSYRAIFTVENGLFTQRVLAHGEFSHQIWERTVYHDDFDEHPERYKNM